MWYFEKWRLGIVVLLFGLSSGKKNNSLPYDFLRGCEILNIFKIDHTFFQSLENLENALFLERVLEKSLNFIQV